MFSTVSRHRAMGEGVCQHGRVAAAIEDKR